MAISDKIRNRIARGLVTLLGRWHLAQRYEAVETMAGVWFACLDGQAGAAKFRIPPFIGKNWDTLFPPAKDAELQAKAEKALALAENALTIGKSLSTLKGLLKGFLKLKSVTG